MSFQFSTPEERIEAARWAYRLFLDREPESETVLAQVQKNDTAALRDVFVTSSEYADRAHQNLSRPLTLVPLNAAANRVDVTATGAVADRLRAFVQATWTRLGEESPHWSVLSSEEFRPENIADTEAAFYGSADYDLAMLLGLLQRHDIKTSYIKTCFEFGCGLGRVTSVLARTFRQVVACDISTTHLNVAIERARQMGNTNVLFVHANSADFGIRSSYDLWFSRIVLQHNPPPIMHAILDRALSHLNRGGIAVFQIPTHATGYSFDVERYLRGLGRSGEIEMHCLPQQHIFSLAQRHGLSVLEVREDFSAGPHEHWISNVFVLKRPR